MMNVPDDRFGSRRSSLGDVLINHASQLKIILFKQEDEVVGTYEIVGEIASESADDPIISLHELVDRFNDTPGTEGVL